MSISLVKEGFSLFAQDMVGVDVHSSFVKQNKILYFLMQRDGVNTRKKLNLARPGVGQVFSGKAIGKVEREALMAVNSYQPTLDKNDDADDGKWMAGRDTRPVLTAGTAQVDSLGTAEFRRCRYLQPIRVYHSDLDRAERDGGSAATQDKRFKDIVRFSTNKATRKIENTISTQLVDGTPTNQNSDPWDKPAGLRAVMSTDNTYGRIPRDQTGAEFWRGKVITDSFASDIFEIIDESTLGAGGTSDYGSRPSLVLGTKADFRKWKKQVLAKSWGQVLPEGLPDMAEFGMKEEILKVDNTYVTWDTNIDSGEAMALNLEHFKMIVAGKWNFTVTEFADQTKIEGGGEYDKAEIGLEFIFACEEPWNQVRFTTLV